MGFLATTLLIYTAQRTAILIAQWMLALKMKTVMACAILRVTYGRWVPDTPSTQWMMVITCGWSLDVVCLQLLLLLRLLLWKRCHSKLANMKPMVIINLVIFLATTLLIYTAQRTAILIAQWMLVLQMKTVMVCAIL